MVLTKANSTTNKCSHFLTCSKETYLIFTKRNNLKIIMQLFINGPLKPLKLQHALLDQT